MIRSTFSGFNTAWLAINASQRAIDVTGHNVSNINTNGYTRQRLDQISLGPNGHFDQYTSRTNPMAGRGTVVTSISQYRDPFLDVRFRNEVCKSGEMNVEVSTLEDLQAVFNENADVENMEAYLKEFTKQLQALSSQSGNPEFDSIVRSAAVVIADALRQKAHEVSDIRQQESENLTNVDITAANDLIKEITELNKNIRDSQIHGLNPLELYDQRNLMLDDLATYASISVTYEKKEVSPGAGVFYDEMTVSLKQEAGAPIELIKGLKGGSFGTTTDAAGNVSLNVQDYDATHAPINGVALQSGSFKGSLAMLNNGGEFDGTMPRGIKYYEKMLDSFANTFATALNNANNGTDSGKTAPNMGNLFESKDGSTITASNIKVSDDWLNGTVHIVNTFDPIDSGSTDKDNSNINYMLTLFDKKMNFQDPEPPNTSVFNGTFNQCYSGIGNTLGLDLKSFTSMRDNYSSVVNGVQDLRDNISSVSLDEEGINMMHYQKSFTAACRLMTTLDEALDSILNMGVVGR